MNASLRIPRDKKMIEFWTRGKQNTPDLMPEVLMSEQQTGGGCDLIKLAVQQNRPKFLSMNALTSSFCLSPRLYPLSCPLARGLLWGHTDEKNI